MEDLTYAFHRSTGSFAAWTSSGRLIGSVCGASCSISGVLVVDLQQRVGEGVERFLAFGLGRLDHQRFRHDQREIDRRRVEAVVQQPLGDVHGADAPLAPQLAGAGHELVHAAVAVRHLKMCLTPAQQIIGVQHRVFADLAQAVRPQRADVAVAAHQHADVAEEAAHPADRLGPIVVQPVAVAVLDDQRRRQDTAASCWRTAIGPAPGPPPPCGPVNVLWTLKCIMSAPKSPGRVMPRMAFMLAPSR